MSLDVEQNNLNEQLISINDGIDKNNTNNNDDFKSNYIDIIIATIITFALPISCRIIEQNIGALIPLLIYYSCCIFVVRFRRGTFNYNIPKNNKYFWIYTIFIPLLILIAAQQIIVYDIVIISQSSNNNPYQWLYTLFIWCPINASLEQLLWVYIYDAFACIDIKHKYKSSNLFEYIFIILGLIMSLAFVGMIHALFWTNFLMKFDENKTPWYQLFLSIKFMTIFGYIVIFKISGSILPLFVLHIITDCNSVIAARYSILPHLWTR